MVRMIPIDCKITNFSLYLFVLSFGRTMMQGLKPLKLAKRTSWDKAMLSGEQVKPLAIAIIELRLSEVIG